MAMGIVIIPKLQLIVDLRKKYRDVYEPERIEDAAAELLNGIFKSGFNVFPLKVVLLMQSFGFEMFRVKFDNPNQSGLIAVDPSLPEQNHAFKGNRVILLNSNDSVGHQRFTVAHELAHYIFDYDEEHEATFYKAYFTEGEQADSDEERRAGRFAAALTMPPAEFKEKYDEIKSAMGAAFSLPDAIGQLMQYFGIPATAVRKRMDELGLSLKEADEEGMPT